MACMWHGVLSLKEKLLGRSNLRFLITVPLLAAFAIAAFGLGRYSAESGDVSQVHGNVALMREKRDSPERSEISTAQPLKGGVVYTRWGRTVCPEGREIVYSGVTGGSFYNNHGGGGNPLCLPMDPIWGNYSETYEKPSKIYGAEYEAPSAFNFQNVGGRSPHDHNIPCVVCRSLTKSSVIMIPARNLCYNDWRPEYTGYLMSSSNLHHGKSKYICVDASPESDPAGYRDENGALFYNVEGVCGSLPCPPYVPRRELTCAVCTI